MCGHDDSRSGGRKCPEDAILQTGIPRPEFQLVAVTQLGHGFDLGQTHQMLFSHYADQGDSITRTYVEFLQFLRCLPLLIDLVRNSERVSDSAFEGSNAR